MNTISHELATSMNPRAPTDDMARFCRSKVNGQSHSRPKHLQQHWGIRVHLVVSTNH